MRQNNRRNGPGSGSGTGGCCVCPVCGNIVKHATGQPCMDMVCSVCNTKMTRGNCSGNTVANKKVAIIDKDKCIGCGRCVSVCPFNAIDMLNGKAVINASICKGCMKCTSVCPANAISGSI